MIHGVPAQSYLDEIIAVREPAQGHVEAFACVLKAERKPLTIRVNPV
jgi:hypothetical protein